MPVFASKDYDDHEDVIFHADSTSGLKAIIAVHSTVRGPALGGCRMWPYETEQQALSDVLRLSRGMTYKAAISSLPFGGGKAVIIGDPRVDKSEALLRAMGRFVDSLDGRYQTAEDVGTTVSDMDILRKETRFAHGFSDGTGNPSPATAYGCFMGIHAAVKHWLATDSLEGIKVAVQGLGNVGYRLCGYLADAGARLLVADINRALVQKAAAEFAATPVSAGRIHRHDADVFSPCALGAVIDDETLPQIGAGIVAGSANNQLARPRHGAALKERGILYAPDYVINAGGLIDVAHEGRDYDPQKVLKQVAVIYDTLIDIFQRSDLEGLSTDVVADHMAEERFRKTHSWPRAAFAA